MPAVCTVDGCTRPHKARGLCGMHWTRWKRTGQLDVVRELVAVVIPADFAHAYRQSAFASSSPGSGAVVPDGEANGAGRPDTTSTHLRTSSNRPAGRPAGTHSPVPPEPVSPPQWHEGSARTTSGTGTTPERGTPPAPHAEGAPRTAR